MSIEIEMPVLERACKDMIETILLCLPNAYKGTIYRIGKPPDLIAERITSGIIDQGKQRISWGLPEKSEYNAPGKAWIDYRDEPDRPLEAMSWCVERQRSWTAEDPNHDARSVRLQVEGIWEDYHHMEPVLVRKSDLRLDVYPSEEYPRDYLGKTIWKNSDYLVVAVIKIHFYPNTIRVGSPETKVIKKLSRSLGTELLSYQLRQESMDALQRLSQDRLNACDILADSLRNAITKSGLIFSLVKQEIGYLREQWEQLLLAERKERGLKTETVANLDRILRAMGAGHEDIRNDLVDVHKRFLEISLPPEKGINWVTMQIQERWQNLLSEYPQDEETTKSIWQNIDQLKRCLTFGQDPEILRAYTRLPEDVKGEWVALIYHNNDSFNASVIESLIQLLANPELDIGSKDRSKKVLIELKALAETMNQLERNTNFLLRQVLNGGGNNLPRIPKSPLRKGEERLDTGAEKTSPIRKSA
ncbi:MAG: hypothetical protein JW821_14285 [Deltaproteobacteria bacterium]|nr:hypothetical protein [Deltaproteobacteria bacterium]